MARERPPTTPEGALLRRARQRLRPKLSMGEAAELAGISADYWGFVERGYQSAGVGQPPREVIPTASTFAHMARAVQLTPDELREAGLEAGARALEFLLRQGEATARVNLPAEAWRVMGELRATAEQGQRTLGELLVEAGLADTEDLVIPDAPPKDPIIAEIEASADISEETKEVLIKMHLENRGKRFEEERIKRKKPGA